MFGACEGRQELSTLDVSVPFVRLVERAMEPWSPGVHSLWPLSFRRGVRLMLLVDRRSRTMPTELWLHVLSFCGCDWFQASGDGDSVAEVRKEDGDQEETAEGADKGVRLSKRRKT